jgi:hypothetical protein
VFNFPQVSAMAKEVRLSSGPGPVDVSPEMSGMPDAPQLEFGKAYLLEAEVSGEGLVQAEVYLYIGDSAPRVIPVWQGFIRGRNKPLRATFTQDAVSARCTDCRLASARIVMRLLSRGQVRIGRTRLRESGFAGSSSSVERAIAEQRGWAVNPAEAAGIRWGLRNGQEETLYFRHAGAYPVALESMAFGVPGGFATPSVAFEVRGTGRFFAHLSCAGDERWSVEELSPDTGWLARMLTATPDRSSIPAPADEKPAQLMAAGFATASWRKISVRLQAPDCLPLSPGAVVSRLMPGAGGKLAGDLVRLSFTTRLERDFPGGGGDQPGIEIRNISIHLGGGNAPQETVRL